MTEQNLGSQAYTYVHILTLTILKEMANGKKQ